MDYTTNICFQNVLQTSVFNWMKVAAEPEKSSDDNNIIINPFPWPNGYEPKTAQLMWDCTTEESVWTTLEQDLKAISLKITENCPCLFLCAQIYLRTRSIVPPSRCAYCSFAPANSKLALEMPGSFELYRNRALARILMFPVFEEWVPVQNGQKWAKIEKVQNLHFTHKKQKLPVKMTGMAGIHV